MFGIALLKNCNAKKTLGLAGKKRGVFLLIVSTNMSTNSCEVCGIVGDGRKIKKVCSGKKPNEELSMESCSRRCYLLNTFGTSLREWSDMAWWEDDFVCENENVLLRISRARHFQENSGEELAKLREKLKESLVAYQTEKDIDYKKQAKNLSIKRNSLLKSLQHKIENNALIYEKTRHCFKDQMEQDYLAIESASIALGLNKTDRENPEQGYHYSRIFLEKEIEKPGPDLKILSRDKFAEPMESIMETLDEYKEQMPEGAYLAMCGKLKDIWDSTS